MRFAPEPIFEHALFSANHLSATPKRHDSQITHVLIPPDRAPSKRNHRARSIGDARHYVLFAAADDLRLPMSEGNSSLSMRLFNWYRPQLVTCPDREVSARLGRVTQFVQPMSSLFAPQIVSRVLLASTSRRIKTIRQKPASPCVAPMPPDAE